MFKCTLLEVILKHRDTFVQSGFTNGKEKKLILHLFKPLSILMRSVKIVLKGRKNEATLLKMTSFKK